MATAETPPGQLACFNARFHYRRKGYVRVRVFATHRAFRAYILGRDGARAKGLTHHGTAALASSFTQHTVAPDGRLRLQPIHGEICLKRRQLHTEIVTHEVAHMALTYARRRGINPLQEPLAYRMANDEEIFCYALGGLATAVVRGLRQRHLIP